jgi:DHA1 family bicyclomycin/chloramphenicol resistance-like MFS transporter
VFGMALGGVSMLLAILAGPGNMIEVMIPMAIYLCGVGLALPQTQIGAMTPFPDKAGAASSLLGLSQMSFAALFGIGVGHMLKDAAWPLGAAVALMGVGSVIAFYVFRPAREAMLHAARR